MEIMVSESSVLFDVSSAASVNPECCRLSRAACYAQKRSRLYPAFVFLRPIVKSLKPRADLTAQPQLVHSPAHSSPPPTTAALAKPVGLSSRHPRRPRAARITPQHRPHTVMTTAAASCASAAQPGVPSMMTTCSSRHAHVVQHDVPRARAPHRCARTR
jgi:hypothetical protein